MKSISIRYFAGIREAVGSGGESLQTTARTVADVRDELISRGGAYAEALSRARLVRTSLNQIMSDESQALTDGAELAFFPPVTGG